MKKDIKALKEKIKDIERQIKIIDKKIETGDFDALIIGGKITTKEQLIGYKKFQILRLETLKKVLTLDDVEIESTLNRIKNSLCNKCKNSISMGSEEEFCAKDFKAFSIYYTVRYGFR